MLGSLETLLEDKEKVKKNWLYIGKIDLLIVVAKIEWPTLGSSELPVLSLPVFVSLSLHMYVYIYTRTYIYMYTYSCSDM